MYVLSILIMLVSCYWRYIIVQVNFVLHLSTVNKHTHAIFCRISVATSMLQDETTAAATSPPITAAETSPPIIIDETSPPINTAETSQPITAAETSPPITAAKTSQPITAAKTSPPITTAETSPPIIALCGTPRGNQNMESQQLYLHLEANNAQVVGLDVCFLKASSLIGCAALCSMQQSCNGYHYATDGAQDGVKMCILMIGSVTAMGPSGYLTFRRVNP